MAIVLRSNTDLVYLPDHGFVGEEGAFRILPQITHQIHRLNVSHNPLGSSGVLVLFKGLSALRSKHSGPELGMGIWGLHEVNLAATGVDDEALDGILSYAKKDGLLHQVYLQGNNVRLLESVESVALSLNMSHVEMISLTNNSLIDSNGLQRFLHSLNSPHLRELHLAACGLTPEAAPAIAEFIRSPRSKSLECLLLNGNQLGGTGVIQIVDAIEDDNRSLMMVGLLANHHSKARADDGSVRELPGLVTANQEEGEQLEYQVHRRLPALLDRNRILTRRVRTAASRAISPARIILNALPPSTEATAQRVISDVSSGASPYNSFRLLDLPGEVIHLIVRHASGDPGALSEGQFTRIKQEAVNRSALKAWSRKRIELLRGKSIMEEKDAIVELKELWLRAGRWDKWERE
ncbi:uncharacterized protein IAS62_003239 [Cryptococcus decagattii]|uniref:RNI-like protein n=1 Tax=Cryptococcus decagattii TaxID=1859122 RepID=A0ABZ2AUK0_9TREE